MIINHNDYVDDILVEKLIMALNTTNEEELITVYLSTKGGDNGIYETVLHLVNSNPERFHFIFYRLCYSNGFRLAINLKCKKSSLLGIAVMCHQSYFEGRTFLDNKNDLPKVLIKEYKLEHNRILKEVLPYLTPDQLVEFNKGEDFYMPSVQFRKILK